MSREPTDEELEQINEAYRERTGFTVEEHDSFPPERVAIIESFKPANPGFTGKAAIVLTDVMAPVAFKFVDEETAQVVYFPEV